MTLALEKEPKIERLGPCSICGAPADWNSPKIDPFFAPSLEESIQKAPIICDNCDGYEPRFLISISQQLRDGLRVPARGFYSCTLGHPSRDHSRALASIVVHTRSIEDLTPAAAWFEDGVLAIPKPWEKFSAFMEERPDICNDCEPLQILALWMRSKQQMYLNGFIYCTSCDKIMRRTEIAGRPLFAGANCARCWEQHQESLEAERRRGHVCGRCGQPYGACCC
jgi:hypothetical protein